MDDSTPALASSLPQELTTTSSSSQPSPSTSTYASTHRSPTEESPTSTNMKLERLYPNHGPMLGRDETLILGGARWLRHFGHNPPVQTSFRVPVILLCILPLIKLLALLALRSIDRKAPSSQTSISESRNVRGPLAVMRATNSHGLLEWQELHRKSRSQSQ